MRTPWLLLPVLLVAGLAIGQEEPGYRFTLNGDPIRPEVLSLRGDPEVPAPGDLVVVNDYLLVLGPPGTYDYRIDWKDVATPIYRRTGSEERLVAATAKKRGKVLFHKLDAETRRGLRGVRLAFWSEEVASALGDLDPEVCALTVDDGIGGDGPGLGLPAGLRHLRLSRAGAGRLNRALEGLDDLRSLMVRSYGKTLDAEAIDRLEQLALLRLTAKSLENRAALGNLPALVDLDLTFYSGSLDIEAIAKIRTLRRLSLAGPGIKDLSALGAHPALRSIRIEMAPLEILPTEPLPLLERLDVMGTRLSDETVAEFRKRHPICRVRHRLDDVLQVELRGATRLRIRSGGTCHRDRSAEKTLLEVTDPEEVARIAAAIRIEGPAPSCQCCGEPTLEFYRGEKMVAELGFHHGQTLRWPGVWPFDGELTKEAAAFLADLLRRE